MPATTTMFRAARPIFSQQFGFASQATRTTFSRSANTGFRFAGRRFQSTASGEAAGQQQRQSWFKRMWESEVGIKTVHFWAPVMKWALVLAGISDLSRPAEKLSLTQNGALTATGIIWTRWCLIIKPKNYLLAAVNFFLGVTGVVQCSRILSWRSSQKNQSLPEQVQEAGKGAVEEVKEVAKGAAEKVKSS